MNDDFGGVFVFQPEAHSLSLLRDRTLDWAWSAAGTEVTRLRHFVSNVSLTALGALQSLCCTLTTKSENGWKKIPFSSVVANTWKWSQSSFFLPQIQIFQTARVRQVSPSGVGVKPLGNHVHLNYLHAVRGDNSGTVKSGNLFTCNQQDDQDRNSFDLVKCARPQVTRTAADLCPEGGEDYSGPYKTVWIVSYRCFSCRALGIPIWRQVSEPFFFFHLSVKTCMKLFWSSSTVPDFNREPISHWSRASWAQVVRKNSGISALALRVSHQRRAPLVWATEYILLWRLIDWRSSIGFIVETD